MWYFATSTAIEHPPQLVTGVLRRSGRRIQTTRAIIDHSRPHHRDVMALQAGPKGFRRSCASSRPESHQLLALAKKVSPRRESSAAPSGDHGVQPRAGRRPALASFRLALELSGAGSPSTFA